MTLYNIDEDTQIDEFGVDHSNFSLRDELEYNFRRAKEKEYLQPHTIESVKADQLMSMPKTNWNDIIMAGITGMGEGMLAGVNRGLNVATFGLYGRAADVAFDNIYTDQQKRLQQRAEQVGLGRANKLANRSIDVGSQFLAAKFLKL